jgi:serine/threonine protein kinase
MSSNQGLSEFLNEVVVISGLKHRNLVKLKGCCLGDGDQRMLVFEYVEKGNLAQALSLSGMLHFLLCL